MTSLSLYKITPRPNSNDPQNLQQCLDIYLNDKLRKIITFKQDGLATTSLSYIAAALLKN